MQIVARNIELLMAAKSLNAAELARKAKVNATGVYDILSGKSRSPRLDTIHKIARALGVPVSRLFEERVEQDLREELFDAFLQLHLAEKRRLIQTAQAWLPGEEPDAPAATSSQ